MRHWIQWEFASWQVQGNRLERVPTPLERMWQPAPAPQPGFFQLCTLARTPWFLRWWVFISDSILNNISIGGDIIDHFLLSPPWQSSLTCPDVATQLCSNTAASIAWSTERPAWPPYAGQSLLQPASRAFFQIPTDLNMLNSAEQQKGRFLSIFKHQIKYSRISS